MAVGGHQKLRPGLLGRNLRDGVAAVIPVALVVLFARYSELGDPSSCALVVDVPAQGSFAGTQSLDGWWGWAKKATFGVKASNENSIACHVHEAQWRHMFHDAEKWDAAAEVIRFHLQ